MNAKKILVTTAAALTLTLSMTLTSMGAATVMVFDNCDDSSTWNAAHQIDTADKKEGAGSMMIDANDAAIFQKTLATPIDLGITEKNGGVDMWIYVQDNSQLGDSQIEFSSSGTCDQDEFHWTPEQMNLQNGWNHVTLKFSETSKDGNPNISAINHFRFYQLYTGHNVVKIDDVKIINLDAAEEAAPAENTQQEDAAAETAGESQQDNPVTGDVSAITYVLGALASGAVVLRRKIK